MKSKTELRAAATARALEVIASEMGAWSADDFNVQMLPNFSAGERRETVAGSVVIERPRSTTSGRVPRNLTRWPPVRCR